jgi:hypothetical protein
MNKKENIKIIYTGLYVLFLAALFVLFAIVQNAAPGTVYFYIFIFIILCLVSGLFFMVVREQLPLPEMTVQNKLAENSEIQNTVPGHAAEEKTGNEEEIDFQRIVPVKFTDIEKYTEELLLNMAKVFHMVQGLLYIKNMHEELYHCYAQYAYFSENKPPEFRTGETLPGQSVKNKKIVSLNNIPEKYMTIASGLGKSDPKHLVFVPLKNQNNEVVGLIEYATFEPLTKKQFKTLEGISEKVAETISKHLKSK